MNIDQFMKWDGGAHHGKLELVDGIVRAMVPASETHGTIQARLAYLLTRHLVERGSGCRVVTEGGVVPRLNHGHNVRVPDLVVTCAPPDASRMTVSEPILLVGVLWPGNEAETWESIRAAVTIPTMTEDLVVDSERIHAEVWRKDDQGAWPKDPEVIESGGAVRLASIDAALAIAEVYAGTQLVA